MDTLYLHAIFLCCIYIIYLHDTFFFFFCLRISSGTLCLKTSIKTLYYISFLHSWVTCVFFFFFFALTLESPLFLSSNSSPVLCMLNLVLDCCKDFIDSRTNRKKSQICKDISNFNAISSVQFSRSVMSNSL